MTEAEKHALKNLAEVKKIDGGIKVTLTLPRWDERGPDPKIKINAASVWSWLTSNGHDVKYKPGDDIRNYLSEALLVGEWVFPLNIKESFDISDPPEKKVKSTLKKKRNK